MMCVFGMAVLQTYRMSPTQTDILSQRNSKNLVAMHCAPVSARIDVCRTVAQHVCETLIAHDTLYYQ